MHRRVGADRHVGADHVVVDRTDEPRQREVRVTLSDIRCHFAELHELLKVLAPLGAQDLGTGL